MYSRSAISRIAQPRPKLTPHGTWLRKRPCSSSHSQVIMHFISGHFNFRSSLFIRFYLHFRIVKQPFFTPTASLRTVITFMVWTSFTVGSALHLLKQTRPSDPASLCKQDAQSRWPFIFPSLCLPTPKDTNSYEIIHRSFRRGAEIAFGEGRYFNSIIYGWKGRGSAGTSRVIA